MKHKLQTMLKNKLQWLLLLAALLGVSQGVWSATYTLYVNSQSGDYYTYAFDFAGGTKTGKVLGDWRGKKFNNTSYFEKIGNNWYKLTYTKYTSGKVIFNQENSGQTSDITLPSSDAFYTYDGNTTFSTLSTSGKYQSYNSILYLSTANYTNWENDNATFKAHLYTKSDCSDRHYIKTINFSATGCSHEYSASISTDLPVLGIKIERYNSTGSEAWNSFTINSFSSSNNGAKVTGWNAGSQYKASDHATTPTVTSTAATSITSSTATLGGNVTDAGQTATCGTQTVSARGIEWVSGTGKTPGSKEAASAGGTGTFTVDVTGLSANTTYTYKAYATNGKGTSYGSEQSFKTEATTCTRPTMVISAKTAETNSFTFKVKASDLGDCTISSWGVKAWTSSSCEGAADFTQAGTGTLTTSDQLVTISGLDANTTYYFKSYAALSPSGEALSSKNTKTTLIVPPSTASSSVTSSTTATLTAEAYSTGGGATTILTAAGFIYSQTKSYIDSNTEASATIANSSVTTVGATYSTEITNLEPNKTYYYKPRIYYSVTNNQSSFKGYGSTTYSFKTNNVFGTVSINNNGVSSVCLGSGTVTWNASASSGDPTSWTVSSSNTTVATATINSSGVITITPKAAGSTTITATAKRAGYDDKTSDGVTITVNAVPTITLTGVGGKSTSATYPWDYMTITATTTPADLVVNWTKLYSGSGSEPVNSVTKSASPSHTYKIKSAITSNPNSDKYTIKANGTKSGCAATEAVYDVYINNPEGEICD